ncbi:MULTISPECIES: tyrosine-type recombinase/integrase [Vibrio]|uniref:tyrosine-type recombinase/integrase n=1 Tax=Vibrio TaxID=662 RepID=UPI00192C4AD1|nr:MULTISPECIES: tyrosine-type recombinase/integrase [Vibrio]MBL4279527.1 site-specific integrase [Vibrio fluvialis]MBY7823489.1 tyrosine-type recombinase/integrase [Vibrio fluvialis]MBY7884677.1 tyrosine-type recombinase/integrase [Vibrio fluvialis]MBY8251525.1 tyrosine-type recombinase/integrase [Vibrio fluvialis]MCR9987024.1 tyrosine-type recombinase/integrase [Vibrio antiquarius]
MIKLSDLEHQNKLLKAQEHVGAHANYLMDVLKPAIERGDWDELENLDIGFTVTGESLGKIGDDDAWRKLQPYFEPKTKRSFTIDFTVDGKVIERNLKNQLKTLLLKMMWLSPQSHSFGTLWDALNDLKKIIVPLLNEGFNMLSALDFDRLETWALTGFTDIDFERMAIYNGLNRLYKEASGLPFEVNLTKKLNASDFGITIKEAKQYTVIPQRLYYLGLQKSEALIGEAYAIRDELEQLAEYIATYFDKAYEGYAKYLVSNEAQSKSGNIQWYLAQQKSSKKRTLAFQDAFTALHSQNEKEALALIRLHKPEIRSDYIDKFHTERNLTIGQWTITNLIEAQSLFKTLNGGCLWGLMARTGMRADEMYALNTTQGCTTETIDRQKIHVIHANLSKTAKGSQSKQDEFVTTEIGMKAYEVLQALHTPLRKRHPSSQSFFHKIKEDFSEITKNQIGKHSQAWFEHAMGEELELTNEDIIDLKTSDPNLSFEVDDDYAFTGHQLRRSFAYYLIGYELCSFPQLKQQFSHVSMAMTRHYAKNASKFQKLRKKKQNLANAIDEERIDQKAHIYLNIYQKLANKERVAGGKGKEFAKNMMKTDRNLFKDKVDNEMLSLNYWKKQIRTQNRHIHAVAPGIYCTSTTCGLRTLVNLMECVDCKNDYIVDAVFAEAKRKEAEIHMLYDIENNELTPQTASESYIKVQAAERIMDDLGIEFEPVIFPNEVKNLLIPYGVIS